MKAKRSLEDVMVPTKAKISALWASAMFCYVYGDLLGFYIPGNLQRMIDGTLMPWPVTSFLLLGFAVAMSIPSAMVALTLLLSPPASRWLNVIVGALETALIAFTMIDAWRIGNYFYIYLGIVECAITLLIVWSALAWPRYEPQG